MLFDMLEHLSCVDELMQIIYQGVNRFVILSSVDSGQLRFHVGLDGSEGRWWRGVWSVDDVLQLLGPNPSPVILEAFADELRDTIVKGELHISGWTAGKDSPIKLTLAPTAKHPFHLPLVELASEEAASYATKVFIDIALQAQSRGCQMNVPAYRAGATMVAAVDSPDWKSARSPPRTAFSSGPSDLEVTEGRDRPRNTTQDSLKSSSPSPSAKSVAKGRAEQTTDLEAKSATQKRARSHLTKPASNKRSLKGASLANPNKKARKYEAIEFESDEEA